MVAHFEERLLVRFPAAEPSSVLRKPTPPSAARNRPRSRSKRLSLEGGEGESSGWSWKLCSVHNGHLNIYEHNNTALRRAHASTLCWSEKLDDARHQIKARHDEGRWLLQVCRSAAGPSTSSTSSTLAVPQTRTKAGRPTTPRLRASESFTTLFSRPAAGPSSFSGSRPEASPATAELEYSRSREPLSGADCNASSSGTKRTTPARKVQQMLPKIRLRRTSGTASCWDEDDVDPSSNHYLTKAGAGEPDEMQPQQRVGSKRTVASRRNSASSSFGSPVTPIDELEPIIEIQTDDEATMLKCVGALNAWVHPSQNNDAGEHVDHRKSAVAALNGEVETPQRNGVPTNSKEHKWLRSPSSIFTAFSERSHGPSPIQTAIPRQSSRHSIVPTHANTPFPSNQILDEDRRNSSSSNSTATFRKRPSSDFISKIMTRSSSRLFSQAVEEQGTTLKVDERRGQMSIGSSCRDAHSQIGASMLACLTETASSTTHSSATTTSPTLSQREDHDDDGDTANTSPGQQSAMLLESPGFAKSRPFRPENVPQNFDCEASTWQDSRQPQSMFMGQAYGGVDSFPVRQVNKPITLSSLRPMSPVQPSRFTSSRQSTCNEGSQVASVDAAPMRSILTQSGSRQSILTDMSQTAPDEPLYSKWRNDSLNASRRTIGLGLQGLRNRSLTVSEGLNSLSSSSKNGSSSAEPGNAALGVRLGMQSLSPSSVSTSGSRGKVSGSSVDIESPIQGPSKPARSRSMLRLLDFLDKREATERPATANDATSARGMPGEQTCEPTSSTELPRKRGAGAIKRIFSSEWQRKTATASPQLRHDGVTSPGDIRDSPRPVSPSTSSRATPSIDGRERPMPSKSATAPETTSMGPSNGHSAYHSRAGTNNLPPCKVPARRGSAPAADILAAVTKRAPERRLVTSSSTTTLAQHVIPVQSSEPSRCPPISQRILPPNEIIATMDRMRMGPSAQGDMPPSDARSTVVASPTQMLHSPCPTPDMSGAISDVTCASSTATISAASPEAPPFSSISNLFPQSDDEKIKIIKSSLKTQPSTETIGIRSPPLAAKNIPTSSFVRTGQRSLPAPRRAVRKSQVISKAVEVPTAPRLPRQRSSKLSAEARTNHGRSQAKESQDENDGGVYQKAHPISPLSKLSFGADEGKPPRSTKSSMRSIEESSAEQHHPMPDLYARVFGNEHAVNIGQAL